MKNNCMALYLRGGGGRVFKLNFSKLTADSLLLPFVIIIYCFGLFLIQTDLRVRGTLRYPFDHPFHKRPNHIQISSEAVQVQWFVCYVGATWLRLVTRKSVFGICDQVRHKPACAATEARQRLEISDIETRDIILSRQRIAKALIRLRGCAFVVCI